MAALTTQQRQDVRARYSQIVSNRRELFGLTRDELDAAVAAIDDWIEANAAAFNSALPVAARTKLTAAQKAELFSVVAMKRYTG